MTGSQFVAFYKIIRVLIAKKWACSQFVAFCKIIRVLIEKNWHDG